MHDAEPWSARGEHKPRGRVCAGGVAESGTHVGLPRLMYAPYSPESGRSDLRRVEAYRRLLQHLDNHHWSTTSARWFEILEEEQWTGQPRCSVLLCVTFTIAI